MSFLIITLSVVLIMVSLFMILLVLIQRGRGGGLAGAFGGMGGQSAFGTRAGDTFTRITIVLAVVWVLLAGGIGMMMRRDVAARKAGPQIFVPSAKSTTPDETKDGAESDAKDATSGLLDDKLPLDNTDTAAPKGEPKAGEPVAPTGTDPATPATGDAKPAEGATPETPAVAPLNPAEESGTPGTNP